MNSYERTMAVFEGRPVDRLPAHPIFMGYAARLIGVSYTQFVLDYRTLVEANLAVCERYGFDGVNCISDAWREAADLGTELEFWEDAPPTPKAHILADKSRLAKLKLPDPLGGGRMHDRVKAADLFRQRVGGEQPIGGWIEGPMAEAVDLRGMNELMLDLVDDPAFVADLMDFVAEMEISFARAQVEAGVDIMGMGDAAASLISEAMYRQFVLPRARRIVRAIHEMGAKVRLHVCGNTTHLLDAFRETGVDQVDIDYPVDLRLARQRLGPDMVMLGNFDPVRVLRNGRPEDVFRACEECHHICGDRYILGAGCEVPRDTPEANVRAMIEYAASTAGHRQ